MERYCLALKDACYKFACPWPDGMVLAPETTYRLAAGPKKSSRGSVTNCITILQ